jgi:tetratricopeptide (TPR) repeat protein
MNKTRFAVILFVLFSAAFTLGAQSPREEFKQMVAQLLQNPSDDTLREKVLQAAANLDPAPAIPEDARRNLIEGLTLHQEAKSPDDEKIALEAFAKALPLAPWWGDIYLGQSVSQELAGQLDDAEKSLRFYLLTNPGEEKARSAQDHIYVLEAKKKKAHAAVQASQQQIEQRKELTGWWHCKSGCNGYKWLQSDSSDLRMQIDRLSFEGHFEQDAITGLATLPGADDPSNVYCAFPEQKHRMTAFVEEKATLIRLKYELTTYQSRSHSQPDPVLGNLSPKHICDSVTPVGTSPQEIVLVGGAKETHFGVAIATLTPGMKDLPTNKETANAVKEGFNYCKKSQKVEAAGVLITSVEPSSSAALGGLKAGDIIHLQSRSGYRNSTLFCTAEEFSNYLKRIPPGNKFELEVFDGSKAANLHDFTMGIRGEVLEVSVASGGTSGHKKSRRK